MSCGQQVSLTRGNKDMAVPNHHSIILGPCTALIQVIISVPSCCLILPSVCRSCLYVHVSVQLDDAQTQFSSFVVYEQTRARKAERILAIYIINCRSLFAGGNFWK